jgi:hypothetical protein
MPSNTRGRRPRRRRAGVVDAEGARGASTSRVVKPASDASSTRRSIASGETNVACRTQSPVSPSPAARRPGHSRLTVSPAMKSTTRVG